MGNPWRFTLPYERAVGLLHDKEYTLRTSADCLGEEQGRVSVIPKVDPDDPLSKSSAVITVQPVDKQKVLFVCGIQNDTQHCLASIKPPFRHWRPHQLLMALPGLEKNRKLLDLHLGEPNRWIDRLEWTMLVIVLCFLATTCHAGYIMTKFVGAKPPAGNSGTRGSAAEGAGEITAAPHKQGFCPVDISNPFAEFQKAWVNSLSFTVASVALVGVLLSVLVKANGPPWLITLTILWPVTCGNLLLYYFWMSTCRLQLYVAALSRGICVRGINPVNPSMILGGGCIVLLLATGYTLLSGGDVNEGMKTASQISPLVLNPMMTLLAIGSAVHSRSLAQHRTQCPLAIDKMVKLMQHPATAEESQTHPDLTGPGASLARHLVSGTVPIISEQSFCEFCRQDLDPVAAIESSEPLHHGPSFRFIDLAWQGRVVYELCGQSVAILNMPVVLFFFLVLTAASVSFGIVGLTVKPSISSFKMSSNRLGRLHPELNPWQVDYELVLDSSVHWATILVTLPQRGTGEMSMHLPEKQEAINTSNRSHLTSVPLDAITYPSYIDIRATGLGRETNYQIAIVKTYHLVIAARVVPISSEGKRYEPRFINGGEVDLTSVFLPTGVSVVELTLLHKAYTMGIPVNESMANSDEAISSDFSTVYQQMDKSSCRTRCKNMARCLKSMSGRNGCFFIWSPKQIQPEEFELAAAAPDQECELGARVCRKENHVFESACQGMEQSRNLLKATLRLQEGFTKQGQQIVNKFMIRFFKNFGQRILADDSSARISFTRQVVVPTAVLGMVPGVNTRLQKEFVKVDHDTEQVVTVTLERYVPTAPELVVYLAVLMSDREVSVAIPRTSRDLCKVDDQQEILNTSLWERQCKQYWKAAQYSVCGGWRPSRIVSCRLEAFTPSIDEYFSLTLPCSFSSCQTTGSKIRVQTKTEDNMQPAQWSLAADCSVDFRVSNTFGDDLLTPEVFMTACEWCPEMVVQTVNYRQTRSIIQYMTLALTRGPDRKQVVGLLDSLVRSPFVVNKTKALQDVGFKMCDGVTCLRIGSTIQQLHVYHVRPLLPSPSRSGLIEHMLDLYNDSQIEGAIGFQALLGAMHDLNEEQVNTLTDYIKKRVKYMNLHGHVLNPSLVAIKTKRHDILKHILEVTTCCFKVWDWYMNQSLWEFAVASGCDKCVSTLNTMCGKANGNRTSLFFSFPTRSSTWAELDGVAHAFKEMPTLTSLGFSLTQDVFQATVMKLAWLSQRGAFSGLERLFFTAERRPPELQVDAESARLLCNVIRRHPRLQTLYFVGDVDHAGNSTLTVCFGESGRARTSLQILRVPLSNDTTIPYVPKELKPFEPLRCTPEANQSEVVSSDYTDSRY